MRWLPYLCFLLPLSYGHTAQQPSSRPPEPKSEPRTSPRPDPKGAEWLKNAAAAFSTKAHPWIVATLWQQVDSNGVYFRADGNYFTGPDHRLHIDLTLQWANSRGNMLTISDGNTLWERMEIGNSGEVLITKTDIRRVRDMLNRPGVPELFRAEFWQSAAFMGIAPLLEQIQQQMIVTNHESIRWRDRDIVKLTAFWSENVEKTLAPNNQPWRTFLPRKCYLYLDASDSKLKYWPYRIEWWGPAPPSNRDQLLVQTEFRDPKVDQPLSAEEMARRFSFNPGTARVQDFTEQLLAGLKNAAQRPPSRRD